MILADRIRAHVIEYYIEPAIAKERMEVSVHSGDVLKEMRLSSRMPAVCGAIDANKFEKFTGVQLLERIGPNQGANAVRVFRIMK